MNKRVKPEQLDLENPEPTPTEKRNMLIEGAKDFDAKYKAETAEEAVDNFLATRAVEEKVISKANQILVATGLEPVRRDYDDFDWSTDDSVVLHEQRATAVYTNRFGGIVIRQEKTWDEESDPYVVICAENFVKFSEALAKRAREG